MKKITKKDLEMTIEKEMTEIKNQKDSKYLEKLKERQQEMKD